MNEKKEMRRQEKLDFAIFIKGRSCIVCKKKEIGELYQLYFNFWKILHVVITGYGKTNSDKKIRLNEGSWFLNCKSNFLCVVLQYIVRNKDGGSKILIISPEGDRIWKIKKGNGSMVQVQVLLKGRGRHFSYLFFSRNTGILSISDVI